MIALAKMWNRSVPTARIPLTPTLISAGSNDESTTSTNATGDQTGTKADENGGAKNQV